MLYPKSYGANPLFPRSCDFEVVCKDDLSGLGVLCHRSFQVGEILAVMHGEVVDEILQHTLQIEPGRQLLDRFFAGYFLHSCSPNISLNMQDMTVTALKPIAANSYLYMDYAETEDVLYRQFHCQCGSANCRGLITGKNELPYTTQHVTEAQGAELN